MSDGPFTQKLLLDEDAVPIKADRGRGHAAVLQLTKNSAVAMVGGVLSQGLKFLVVIYVARQLSIAEFGLVSFAMAVNAYIFVVSNFGLSVFGSRAVATSGVSQGLLSEIACLRACLAFVAIVLGVGILWLTPEVGHLELTLVGIFGVSNIALAGLFDWAFQGLHRQEVSAVLNIVWQGGWFALTVAGIHFGMGILAVPTALVGATIVAASIGYLWLRRTVEIPRGDNVRMSVMRRSWEILKRAAPLGWGTLLVTFLVWSDAVVVRLMRGDRAAGVYAAGNRGGLALAMLASFYVLGALPHLSQASTKDWSQFTSFFQRTYKDLALLFLPGALWTISYAPEIIQLLFKQKEYSEAVSVFRLFQVTLLANVGSNLYGIGALVANHRDRAYQKTLLISALAFLPLCPILTKVWGIEGAAIAALSAQILCLLLTLFEARDLVPSNHGRALFLPLVAGAGVAFTCRLLGLSLFEGVPVLVIGYAGLLSIRARSLRRERIQMELLEES
jgi:O-antigen/teichoic acid export membrane protein